MAFVCPLLPCAHRPPALFFIEIRTRNIFFFTLPYYAFFVPYIIFNDVTRNLRWERQNNKAARKIIFGNVSRLRFIQILASKRLKEDARTQVNNCTFIFIYDKVFDRIRVPCALTHGVPSQSRSQSPRYPCPAEREAKELSFSDRWSGGTKLWERDWFHRKSLEHDNWQRHHVIEKVSTKPIELELLLDN